MSFSLTPCLVFTDLDGTLLDHFTYSHQAAKLTIEKLQTANIPIIINTSKTFAEVIDIQKALSISAPFIVENGAAIFLPKAQFPQQPNGCYEYQEYWYKPFSKSRQTWIDLLKTHGQPYREQYQGFSTLTDKVIANLTGLSLADAAKANQRMFNEPVLWHDEQDKADAFISHLKQQGAHVLKGGRFIHIGDHTDKGNALNWLTRIYQQNTQETITTIALGDGENDNAMLEVASIAVQVRSPAHSFPSLKPVNFTYQTTQYGPKGWAEAIQFLTPKIVNNTLNVDNSQERKYG